MFFGSLALIPEGRGRVGESGELPITNSQLLIPDFLLLVNAIEQPKSPDNSDKVSNSGVSIGQYDKYV